MTAPRKTGMDRMARSVLAALAAAACWQAVAQDQQPPPPPRLKPGLWEVRIKDLMDPRDAEQMLKESRDSLATLAPDQRRQVEAYLATVAVDADGIVSRGLYCVTQQMLEQDDYPRSMLSCPSRLQSRRANLSTFTFACGSWSGEELVALNGPESYSTSSRSTNSAPGEGYSTLGVASGRWLRAECGDVAPHPRPPAQAQPAQVQPQPARQPQRAGRRPPGS